MSEDVGAAVDVAGDVEIRVNLDGLYVDDLEIIGRFEAGKLDVKEFLDLLDRVVEGGVRGRRLPFAKLREIGAALRAAMSEAANPEGN